jgi:hypothetical protein
MKDSLIVADSVPCTDELNLHLRGPRWSAGPLRCRTKACHSTRGLMSALTGPCQCWKQQSVVLLTMHPKDACSCRAHHACEFVQTCLTCCLGV